MVEETSYFWLNCGYNRWNHNEPMVGQTTLFESGAQFNPSQGFRSFKQAKVGDKVVFYQVQMDTGLLGFGEITSVQTGAQNKIRVHFQLQEQLKPLTADYLKRSDQLEFRMSNMKETLFNQITKEEFELIVSLGKGKPKYLDTFLYQKHKSLNLIHIIQYTRIRIMVLNEMATIFIRNLKLGIKSFFIIRNEINLSLV